MATKGLMDIKGIATITGLIAAIGGCFLNPVPHTEPGDYAIVGVNVIPMISSTVEVLANKTVIIKADSILAIVDANEAQLDNAIQIINGHGKYLIPGMLKKPPVGIGSDCLLDDVSDSMVGVAEKNDMLKFFVVHATQ